MLGDLRSSACGFPCLLLSQTGLQDGVSPSFPSRKAAIASLLEAFTAQGVGSATFMVTRKGCFSASVSGYKQTDVHCMEQSIQVLHKDD